MIVNVVYLYYLIRYQKTEAYLLCCGNRNLLGVAVSCGCRSVGRVEAVNESAVLQVTRRSGSPQSAPLEQVDRYRGSRSRERVSRVRHAVDLAVRSLDCSVSKDSCSSPLADTDIRTHLILNYGSLLLILLNQSA